MKQRTFEITEKYRQLGHIPADVEITQNMAHECILKEITATLAHRKRLHAQVGHLQSELSHIERAAAAAAASAAAGVEVKREPASAPPLHPAPAGVPVATVKPHTVHNKPHKSRDYRSRSQDWPEMLDIAKIEEQNPEVLAQKILETGRQLEAARHPNKQNVIVNGYARDDRYPKALTPHMGRAAPPPDRQLLSHRHSPVKLHKAVGVITQPKVQESPKVINFEDRLKSIITSVLNEDQEQRKASARQPTHTHGYNNGYVRQPPHPGYPQHPQHAPHPQHPPHSQHPQRGSHPSQMLPAPGGGPVGTAGYVRSREFRRDRYPYERRELPRDMPRDLPRDLPRDMQRDISREIQRDMSRLPPGAHIDPRMHHVPPDYTQVSVLITTIDCYRNTVCYVGTYSIYIA